MLSFSVIYTIQYSYLHDLHALSFGDPGASGIGTPAALPLLHEHTQIQLPVAALPSATHFSRFCADSGGRRRRPGLDRRTGLSLDSLCLEK